MRTVYSVTMCGVERRVQRIRKGRNAKGRQVLLQCKSRIQPGRRHEKKIKDAGKDTSSHINVKRCTNMEISIANKGSRGERAREFLQIQSVEILLLVHVNKKGKRG